MPPMRPLLGPGSFVVLAACVGSPPSQPGPRAEIPVFAADDARVSTPGFVQQTLRLRREQAGATYTLMAFVVGDKATFGAMVKGPFTGRVRWRIGARQLEMGFDAANPGAQVPVAIDGRVDNEIRAQGAAFRGTAWTNVELPAAWLVAEAPLALQFAPVAGAPIDLPGDGRDYVVQLVPR